jgi:P27 family predicted phage terminase small subunit
MPVAPDALSRCLSHLLEVARKEWRRLATPLYRMGVLSVTDRAALAAYCVAWSHWVEAEEHLAKGPPLIKTPSGYVQQSPWLSIANKQLEIMAR